MISPHKQPPMLSEEPRPKLEESPCGSPALALSVIFFQKKPMSMTHVMSLSTAHFYPVRKGLSPPRLIKIAIPSSHHCCIRTPV